MLHYAKGATPWMYEMSRDILQTLDKYYPGHPWAVNIYGNETGGGYFIRHLDFPTNWGYNQPRAHLFGSWSLLLADVVKGAGEILERSYLARAKWDEDSTIKKMDGVPLKYQPLEYRKQVEQEKLKKETDDRLQETQPRSV